MMGLGTLGGSSSQAEDINNLGQIVGGASTSSGAYHPFLWEMGTVGKWVVYDSSGELWVMSANGHWVDKLLGSTEVIAKEADWTAD